MTVLHSLRLFLNDQRGAAAVEFAFIVLPLMLLLAGSIEISRYIWTRLALQDVASSGARCLGLQLTPCFRTETLDMPGTVGFLQQAAAGWVIELNETSITADDAGICQSLDGFAKIGIRHEFKFVLMVLPETVIDVEACFPVMPSG